MAAPGTEGQNGLAQLSHAIRRSAAMHFAIETSTADLSDDELFARADRFAQWIRGEAGDPHSPPLGQSSF